MFLIGPRLEAGADVSPWVFSVVEFLGQHGVNIAPELLVESAKTFYEEHGFIFSGIRPWAN